MDDAVDLLEGLTEGLAEAFESPTLGAAGFSSGGVAGAGDFATAPACGFGSVMVAGAVRGGSFGNRDSPEAPAPVACFGAGFEAAGVDGLDADWAGVAAAGLPDAAAGLATPSVGFAARGGIFGSREEVRAETSFTSPERAPPERASDAETPRDFAPA